MAWTARLQIIRQLQGAEFPAAAWESEVLPRRVARYQPEYLDDLCLAGEVTWGRLSPHPAFEREPEENRPPRAAHARGAARHLSARRRALAAGRAATIARGIALAPGARSAGGHRNRTAHRSSPT